MSGAVPAIAYRPSRARIGRAVATSLVLLGAASALRAQPQARVSLDPQVVALDELAVLSVEVEGGGFAALRVRPLFELENFDVVGGPHHETQLQQINGRFSQRTRILWELRPRRVGPARVYALRVELGDDVLTLPDQQVEVEHGRAAPSRSAPGGRGGPPAPFSRRGPVDALEELGALVGRGRHAPAIFLRAELDPPQPWVGQQALYTVWLYTQGDVGAIEPVDVPQFQRLWSQEVPQPGQLQPEWVEAGGERFGRVALHQRAVFALAPGRYEIEPYSARLQVRVAQQTLFGPLFGHYESLSRATEPIVLNARALPPAPPGFFGAVGRLALDARLSPGEVEVGRATTLAMTLSGAGHLEGLADPTLPPLPGVTIHPPHQESREEVKDTTVRGRRAWSYVLVPQRAGRWTLPAVEVTYFDPEASAYRVARSAPMSLLARPAAPVARREELHPLRSAALPGPTGRRLDATLTLLFAVPWGVAALVLGARRLGGGGETAAARRTLRQALEAAAREPRPRQAAAGIEEAWRTFLGHRWHVPPGAASTTWADLLRAQGADVAAARELVRLADDLHYLRYAPQLSATDTVCREVVDRSLRLAARLR